MMWSLAPMLVLAHYSVPRDTLTASKGSLVMAAHLLPTTDALNSLELSEDAWRWLRRLCHAY